MESRLFEPTGQLVEQMLVVMKMKKKEISFALSYQVEIEIED